MSSVVDIDKVIDVILVSYHADIPILLEGSHGIGKSSVFEQVARILDIPVVVLDLSLLEPFDLIGIPKTDADNRTIYCPPAILPSGGRGILLLEEVNRASRQTRAPALELLTRRKLNDYVLPSGWLPCASINPDGALYDVDALDPALKKRFLNLKVQASYQGWLTWAEENDVHSTVIAFVLESPDIFSHSDVDPRSLYYASRFLKSYEQQPSGDKKSKILLNGLAGLIGENMARALFRFYKSATISPDPKEILADYAMLRPTVRQLMKKGQLDIIATAVRKMKHLLQRQQRWEETISTSRTAENLKQFLGDIAPDIAEGFFEWADDRGYDCEALQEAV